VTATTVALTGTAIMTSPDNMQNNFLTMNFFEVNCPSVECDTQHLTDCQKRWPKKPHSHPLARIICKNQKKCFLMAEVAFRTGGQPPGSEITRVVHILKSSPK
jgi:hypothetical protein